MALSRVTSVLICLILTPGWACSNAATSTSVISPWTLMIVSVPLLALLGVLDPVAVLFPHALRAAALPGIRRFGGLSVC